MRLWSRARIILPVPYIFVCVRARCIFHAICKSLQFPSLQFYRSECDPQGKRLVRDLIPTVTHQPPDGLEDSCTNRPIGSPPYARPPLPKVDHLTGEKAGLSGYDEHHANTSDGVDVPGQVRPTSYLGKALWKNSL